jgi:ABC-type lipoprotein release transport system permease subunit
LIIGWGLVEGLDENVIRAQEDTTSGHVMLRPLDYPTDNRSFPLSMTQVLSPSSLDALEGPDVQAWTSRLVFSAQATLQPPEDTSREVVSETIPVKGFGFDPEREDQVFPREDWTLQGTWPQGEQQVVLGSQLADMMGVVIGDTIDLKVRAKAKTSTDEDAQGSVNLLAYKVQGIVETRNPAMDLVAVWMELEEADALLFTGGARSHIAVRLDHRDQSDAFSQGFPGDWHATTATEEVADLIAINAFRRRAISMIVFILLAIAGTGIANTVIMAAYERVREIGTLQALGLSRGGIRGLFLFEGAIMGLVAGLVGATLGSAVVLYFSKNGIDLSDMARSAGQVSFSTMLYMRFDWNPVFWALGFGVGVSLLASIYPAQHAARMNPADAVRAD